MEKNLSYFLVFLLFGAIIAKIVFDNSELALLFAVLYSIVFTIFSIKLLKENDKND